MQKINIRNLFRLGKQNKIRPLHFILANRSKEKLGEIDNVFDISYHPQLQTSELSFTVYKKADSKNCRLWDEIIPRRLLWVKEYEEWFEISVDIDESEKISKKIITATALCQSELSQIKMNSTEINTEADISRPDYEVSTFYNPDNIKASILHRVLEKVPNYSIKHVDTTLQKIQRSFSISNDTYIYDFLTGTLQEEIGCLFLFDSNERGIYVYDMETTCLDCDYRDETAFTVCPICGKTNIHKPYGDDTSIFVSKDNLGENIKLTSTANEVKNCFKVTGGDEFINAAVINSNPNGTDTIYVFDEDTKHDMPDELVAKLNEYEALLEEYRTTREFNIPDDVVNEYNKLISKINNIYPDKFSALNSSYSGYSNIIKLYYDTFDLQLFLESSMMPTWEQNNKTAQSQVDLVEKELKTVSLKDVSNISQSTADNAVLLMVKAIIDTNYKAEVINSSFASQTWSGQVKLTNYYKAEDAAVSNVLTVLIDDNVVSFIEQRLQKATAKIDTTGIKELFSIDDFDLFNCELKKYCLASLKGFSNAYQTVLDVLVEEHISDTESEFYNEFYVPYYNKLGAIEAEISVRDIDIAVVDKLQNELQNIITGTHETLDFEKYLGTDLWNTFLSYRREDKYSNENYISNGLNNEQLITKAQELIDAAYKELTKSSTKQYTITGTLHNLLLIVDEDGNQVFKPILDDFTLGNFIRCKIDGVIYRMRIMDVTINYTNLKSLSITFGDVSKNRAIINKMSDVIKQTNSIACSYSTIKKQAKQGEKADYTIEKLRKEGLDSAQYNIFNTNSTFIMDNHGLLGRNYDDVTDQFSDEWVRINGSNIIFSNDGGKSTKFAIGKQKYSINGTQYEEYGVNTDFVLGGKIIGGDIYSANYANDGDGNIVGNHFDLLGSNFELADGNIIYDKSKNKLSFKNVTMQWDTINNLSTSDVNELDEKLDTASNTANTAKTTADSALSKANANATNISNLETTVTTQGTHLTMVQGQISSKIWQEDITNAVNNIEIGGRNLIAGTDLDTIYEGLAGEKADTFHAVTINPATGTDYIVSFEAKADIVLDVYCFFYLPNTTISAISSTGQTSSRPDGGVYVTLSTEWKRYWVKWTQSSTDAVKNLIIGRTGNYVNKVYIRAVKLEEGNKATDWTPAPEDTKNSITTLSTQYSTLNQTVNGIQTTVGSHTTSLNGLETRVENAESNIDVNAQAIATKVSYNGVISAINQSAEEVKIQASKIALEGAVTISALDNSLKNTIENTSDTAATALTTATTVQNKVDSWSSTGNTTLIDGAKIYTGSITADAIAANSITSDKLSVGRGANIYATGYDTFEQIPNDDISNSGYQYSCVLDSSTAYYGTKCLKYTSHGTSSYMYLQNSKGTGTFRVVPGQTYIISWYAKSSTTLSYDKLRIMYHNLNSTGESIRHQSQTFPSDISTDWHRYYTRYTVPSDTFYLVLRFDNYTGNNTIMWLDAIQVEKGTSSQEPSEFTPAGVTTINGANIATGTITGDQIAANSINGDRIAAGTITGDRIAAGTVLASNVTAKYMDVVEGTLTTHNSSTGGIGLSVTDNCIDFYSITDINNFAGKLYVTSESGVTTQQLRLDCDYGDYTVLGYRKTASGTFYDAIKINDPAKNDGAVTINTSVSALAGLTASSLTVNGQTTVNGQFNSQNAVVGYLTVNAQDSVHEGGEIWLDGAGTHTPLAIDNYMGDLRIFDRTGQTLVINCTDKTITGGYSFDGGLNGTFTTSGLSPVVSGRCDIKSGGYYQVGNMVFVQMVIYMNVTLSANDYWNLYTGMPRPRNGEAALAVSTNETLSTMGLVNAIVYDTALQIRLAGDYGVLLHSDLVITGMYLT